MEKKKKKSFYGTVPPHFFLSVCVCGDWYNSTIDACCLCHLEICSCNSPIRIRSEYRNLKRLIGYSKRFGYKILLKKLIHLQVATEPCGCKGIVMFLSLMLHLISLFIVSLFAQKLGKKRFYSNKITFYFTFE